MYAFDNPIDAQSLSRIRAEAKSLAEIMGGAAVGPAAAAWGGGGGERDLRLRKHVDGLLRGGG